MLPSVVFLGHKINAQGLLLLPYVKATEDAAKILRGAIELVLELSAKLV